MRFAGALTAIEVLCTLAASLSLAVASDHSTAPIVTDHSGRSYCGFKPVSSVQAFLGIPYAQPPVGPLRWKPPQPLPPPPHGDSIHDASKFGNTCYQVAFEFFLRDPSLGEENIKYDNSRTEENEDCLTLNVWVPERKDKKKLLPVLLWIHGGGFLEGGSAFPLYDGANLVKAHQDVIVVTFNYRLNIFGFPSTASIPVNETNLGLFDQRQAIIWVRDNIAHFGGDPGKITLFGESAGSASVITYMFSYPDDPIARGFIAQSQYDLVLAPTPTEFARISKNVGCVNKTESQMFQCMMNANADSIAQGIRNRTLIRSISDTHSGGSPVADNITAWTPGGYLEQAEKGKFAHKPLLIGNTHQEGDLIVPFDAIKGINYTASDLVTIALFGCPTARFANMLAHHNTVYRYRYMPTFPSVTPFWWPRAYHGSELPILFGNQPKGVTQMDYEKLASSYLQGAWVAFAKDPENGLAKYKGKWPKYNPNNPKKKTLVELFPGWAKDDTVPGNGQGVKAELVRFEKPIVYDAVCANIPI